MVAATGVGPWLAGKAYEVADRDFVPILALFAFRGVPLAIASLLLRPPKPPAVRDRTPERDEPDPIGPAG